MLRALTRHRVGTDLAQQRAVPGFTEFGPSRAAGHRATSSSLNLSARWPAIGSGHSFEEGGVGKAGNPHLGPSTVSKDHTAMSFHHPVDVYVGARVRQARILRGWNQHALATAVGLTYQQVQKYELGSNTLSAGRLYEFASALGVPVSHFFEGMLGTLEIDRGRILIRMKSEHLFDHSAQRETMNLVRAFYEIEDSRLRKHVIQMIRKMAEASEVSTPPRETSSNPSPAMH
jgi:transcriptional regulator with XRE-family HTH domain